MVSFNKVVCTERESRVGNVLAALYSNPNHNSLPLLPSDDLCHRRQSVEARAAMSFKLSLISFHTISGWKWHISLEEADVGDALRTFPLFLHPCR